MVDSAGLLALARRAARNAGAELLRRYGRVNNLATKSSQTDPVSDADRASEYLLQQILLDERPCDGIIGEEGAARAGSSGITWVVDPLDGTVNYLYQLDGWSVSVAAEDEQGALVGVVYEPLTGREFAAIRGAAAWMNGAPIRTNEPVTLGQALLSTGFSYHAGIRARQAALIAQLLPAVRDIRRIGSAALDLCHVGGGFVDAHLEEDLNHWDWAAGALIAREAGAVVTTVSVSGGRPGLLAAGPSLHAQLSGLLGLA